MTKKALSIFMLIALVVGVFSGCTTSQESPAQQEEETTELIITDEKSFKLSYTQSDSLNPYESDSLNNFVLEDLVFDSLFKLDESLEAVPEIAEKYSYPDDTTLNVVIKSNLKFSDGTDLTAQSVVNAFENAKSSPIWSTALAPILSAYAQNAATISFDLAYKNPLAHQLLTFYIAKITDEKYPIGSGRYAFTEGDGRIYLQKNDSYSNAFNPRFTRITLINIPSAESIDNALSIGNISYAFRDLSKDDVSRIKSNKKRISQNNLVYVGINCNYGITKNISVRQAISLAIDRGSILKSAYQGCGRVATSVFHPSTRLGKETIMFGDSADVATGKQALSKSGYSSPSLTILVNDNKNRVSAAMLIKQQLEAVGFRAEVRSLSDYYYRQALSNGSYDIYIGETKIPNDMRLTSFFSQNGETAFGIDQAGDCAVAYNEYINSDAEIGKFTLGLSVEIPFIPVLYRDGMLCFSTSLHGDIHASYGDFFSNIEDWYYN